MNHVFYGDYLDSGLVDMNFNVGGYDFSLAEYLGATATIISITIIVVFCCLFVWKIIKLIGGLIR